MSIHKYLAGPLGGKQQLGAQIAQNDIDALIFLRDPTTAKTCEPDVNKHLSGFVLCIISHFHLLLQQS